MLKSYGTGPFFLSFFFFFFLFLGGVGGGGGGGGGSCLYQLVFCCVCQCQFGCCFCMHTVDCPVFGEGIFVIGGGGFLLQFCSFFV